jgi:hypothetical protein
MERTALPAFTEGDDILVTAQDGTTMEGAFTGYLPGRDRHTVCVTVRRQVGGTWPHGSAMPVDHAASMVPVTDANTTRTDPETPFASVAFDAAGSVEFTAQDQDFHYTLGARPAVDRELGRVRDNLYGLIAMITGHRLADLIDRPASIRCYRLPARRPDLRRPGPGHPPAPVPDQLPALWPQAGPEPRRDLPPARILSNPAGQATHPASPPAPDPDHSR